MIPTKKSNRSVCELFRLMEFTDSALPVGGFSFSCGVETATVCGMIHDEESLGAYLLATARQVATCDGVAALAAHRAMLRRDWRAFLAADRRIGLFKTGDENRRMSLRMGHKLGQLARHILPQKEIDPWSEAVERGEIEGHHAPMQGLLFALTGESEERLFASLLYGAATQITGAALRLMRIDHFATQRLLYALGEEVARLYEELSPLEIEEMHLFGPEREILASMHEAGPQRMFMN